MNKVPGWTEWKARGDGVSQRGVTLIELIAFIIIVGLLVSGVIGGFSATMRGSGVPKQVTQALQLAQPANSLRVPNAEV